MISKLGSGATVTIDVPSSAICVLQARRGWPLMNIPHEPHTPMRHDDRQASPGDRVSLIVRRPSSTVMPSGQAIGWSSHTGVGNEAGSNRRILNVTDDVPIVSPPA